MSRDLLWIGFLALVYVVLKYRPDWFNRLAISVGGKAIGKAALAAQPDTLTLEPIEAAPGVGAKAALETLSGRGFAPAGSFAVVEMQRMPIHFMTKDDECAITAVYEHPKAGAWTDIVCRYQNGTSFTVTNARMGGGLEPRPGHTSVRAPGLTTAALHMRFSRERPAGSLVRVAPHDVAAFFTEAYAEEIAWRKGRGISKDEVRAVAREMEQSADQTAA